MDRGYYIVQILYNFSNNIYRKERDSHTTKLLDCKENVHRVFLCYFTCMPNSKLGMQQVN